MEIELIVEGSLELIDKIGGSGGIVIFSEAIGVHPLTLSLRSFPTRFPGNIHHQVLRLLYWS